MRLLSLVTIVAVVAPVPVGAQTTPWGDPDLQGLWTNQTPTLLQRPEALAEKEFFTEEEAADFEKTALEDLRNRFAPSGELELSGEFNEIWFETLSGKVAPSRRTSLVVNPPDGRIPYTPDGKKRWDARPRVFPTLARGPEDTTLSVRCLLMDGVMIPNPFYNNHHHIFQTPEYVAILTEMMHEVRIIPLDRRERRPPLAASIRQWLGVSRGWWEGQTLVVETTHFNDKRRFRGATEHLRLVERFTRLDDGTTTYRLTVTDPETFTGPWTLENPLRKAEGPMYEVACHEGNYSMTGILAGARAEEKK